jgi:hypothetical protein
MRLTAEEKAFNSLIKEHNTFIKYGSRADAPKVERDYYFQMAQTTLAQANSIPLRKKVKRSVAQDSTGEE